LFFALRILIRLLPRRTGGELVMMDLVFVLLIAEAAAHALGDYNSVADGIIMIETLMGWNCTINALTDRFPGIERLVSSPLLKIIQNGELLRRNMRRELVTEEELMSNLRQEGIERVEDVKTAYVEPQGKITVIAKDSHKTSA
jgi:uncharacterized membrane protein YcaP (DUF421 family)